MRIAIEGCTHGELDKIYQTVAEIEESQGYKVGVSFRISGLGNLELTAEGSVTSVMAEG